MSGSNNIFIIFNISGNFDIGVDFIIVILLLIGSFLKRLKYPSDFVNL